MNDIRPYSISFLQYQVAGHKLKCGALLLPRITMKKHLAEAFCLHKKVPLKIGGNAHFPWNKTERPFFRYYGLEIPLGTLHAGRGTNSGEGMEVGLSE